jgi:hypothetical protein
LLWKFAGLGAGRDLYGLTQNARQRGLAENEWYFPPLAAQCGFIATEWHSCSALTAAHLDARIVDKLCRYILQSAKPPSDISATESALERLKTMCACNFRECGREDLGKAALESFSALDFEGIAHLATAGDGRMAPHEWLQHRNRILKTDVWGHDFDHTYPGPQSILWDFAGAIMEWRMAAAQVRGLLQNLQQDAAAIPLDWLRPYLFAYAAFRIGMCSLASDSRWVDEYLRQLSGSSLVSGGKCFAQGY